MSSIQKAYLELFLTKDCKARSLFRQKRWGCTEEDSQFNEPVPYGCAIGKSFASKCGSETYIVYTRITSCRHANKNKTISSNKKKARW